MKLKILKNISIVLSLLLLLQSCTSAENSNEKITYKNFSLFDYNNVELSLNDLTDKKGIVIIFVSTKCPVSNDYNERMEKLFNTYNNDFSFVGINSNKSEDMSEMKTHAEDNSLTFTILKDSNNVIADQFKASFTPEVYVLNNELTQLYHGRIDDSRRGDNIENKDLENALKNIINGEEVAVEKTKAFGCTIKRVD